MNQWYALRNQILFIGTGLVTYKGFCRLNSQLISASELVHVVFIPLVCLSSTNFNKFYVILVLWYEISRKLCPPPSTLQTWGCSTVTHNWMVELLVIVSGDISKYICTQILQRACYLSRVDQIQKIRDEKQRTYNRKIFGLSLSGSPQHFFPYLNKIWCCSFVGFIANSHQARCTTPNKRT
jgi:hypothetical protein